MSEIRHKGFVKTVNSDKMIVTIVNQSACSTCHAKGACTVSDFQDKDIEINEFSGNYQPGQEVTVVFKESKGFGALLWGYVLPFLVVLITLIVVLEITDDELKAGLISLAMLIPYYTTLYFLRHHLKKIFKFEVEETN